MARWKASMVMWCKNNGIDHNKYSDDELMKMRQDKLAKSCPNMSNDMEA